MQYVESQPTFWRNISSTSSRLKKRQTKKIITGFLLDFSSMLKMVAIFASETSLDIQRIHSLISQETEFFLTTVVGNLNPRKSAFIETNIEAVDLRSCVNFFRSDVAQAITFLTYYGDPDFKNHPEQIVLCKLFVDVTVPPRKRLSMVPKKLIPRPFQYSPYCRGVTGRFALCDIESAVK
jgi:hypothetical protein